MNAEYTYMLQSFLPEIVLVAVGMLVLVVDLLLGKRNTRHALTLAAALGCLLAAGVAAVQWQHGNDAPPRFVSAQIGAMGQQVGWANVVAHIETLTPAEQSVLAWMISGQAGEQPAFNSPTAARHIAVVVQRSAYGTPNGAGLTLAHPGYATWWLFANDRFTAAFKVIFALAAFLVLLMMVRFPLEKYRGEFAGLLCFATVGLMVMVSSLDLVVLFLGLELASVCLYALAAWRKDDPRSAEAGIKYLLLGSLASAFFIYGASLLFVRFGTTHLGLLAQQALHPEPLVIIGFLMLLVGFAFKVAAAPFHLWAPDVYQGSPTPMVAFLSTASKAAGFAVLLRVLGLGFINLSGQWVMLVGLLAALSMIIGNLVAVHQNNVKRLLAYSGIAQSGYIMVALFALGLAYLHGVHSIVDSVKGVILYLFLYMFTNIGVFAVTGIVGHEEGNEEMTAFAGLRSRAPLMAFGMTVLLLSLGGIPLLSGFVGKWFLFLAAVNEGQYLIVLLGAALSVVSIYYYLLVVKQIYIKPPTEDAKPIQMGVPAGLGLLIIVLMTVAIGAYPGPFLNLAELTAKSLLGM